MKRRPLHVRLLFGLDNAIGWAAEYFKVVMVDIAVFSEWAAELFSRRPLSRPGAPALGRLIHFNLNALSIAKFTCASASLFFSRYTCSNVTSYCLASSITSR
jgi:hypothetical protein